MTSGSGTVTSGNVSNVSVSCTTDTFAVGGTVSGMVGSGLILQDNGGNNLPVAANGSFTFPTLINSGSAFQVTVLTQPTNPAQICTVTNGSGTVTTGAITTVTIVCPNYMIVPDFSNNRVLIYDAPLSTNQSANVVLGQPNFTTATAGTTASTMNDPVAVAADKSGNLYVSEDKTCRVIQFVPPFSNGMSASLVFGQTNLNTGVCPATTSATSLGNSVTTGGDEVTGVNVDSSGNLWVADDGSNRVVEYKPPFSNGMAASLAIGQPDLTSGGINQGNPAPTSSSLYDPGMPIFDRSGNLWLSDFNNNRVLEFTPPFSTGMAATLVLGQADYTHNSSNEGGSVAANTLSGSYAVAFDSSGNMWVTDLGNNRVLEFQPPFTVNMNASLVLGQPDFTHNLTNQGGPAPTSSSLNFPFQVAFDANGNLLVNDAGNNRTLVFTPPFSNGMAASLVIGQANFTSVTAATTATGQSFPTGVIAAPPLY